MSGTIQHSESCQDSDDSSIGMARAIELIRTRIKPISGFQSVALREALGRRVAEPVISPMNVPAHRNSAMDGYALRGSDLPPQGERTLRLIGTAFAGRPFDGPVQQGECVRIMTGAKMPDDCDSVVIQERARVEGERVSIDHSNRAGQNVRQAGEDIAVGAELFPSGRQLGAAQLGLLASLGIAEVRVRRRARVAFFSSGDEIRSIGEPLAEGQIYDSNRYTLYGMLQRLGVEPVDLGVIPDREQEITAALEAAAVEADMILTSGGVSVGEADHVVAALRRLGRIHFSKVAIKPGRPLTFGHIGETPFFGLPGNPVAVMITFLQFTRLAILQLMGAEALAPPTFTVRCRSQLRKSPGRTEFQRGLLQRSESGELCVVSSGRQGSGILSSMSDADCFILLPETAGSFSVDDRVQVQPLALFD